MRRPMHLQHEEDEVEEVKEETPANENSDISSGFFGGGFFWIIILIFIVFLFSGSGFGYGYSIDE